MQVNISRFQIRILSEPLSIRILPGSNGDSAEGRVFTMSRNIFMSIDATVIPLCPGFIIDPSDCRCCPFPAPETSSLPGVRPDTGGADALSCRSDGRSAAHPRLCRWLLRLLLVVILGREAGSTLGGCDLKALIHPDDHYPCAYGTVGSVPSALPLPAQGTVYGVMHT